MITIGLIFSVWQWLLVIALVLIVFGAKRLPEIGKGLGQSIREFKTEVKDDGPGSKAKVVDAKVVEEEKREKEQA